MAIVVSNPVRRPPCCVNRNVRYGSQGTHRDGAANDSQVSTPDMFDSTAT